jgi:DNA-binding LytR/AlgR family response regulator
MRALRRIPFAAGVGLFAVYSYVATTVSASWFLRRNYGADLPTSLLWAGLLYAPSVATGLMVWAALRLFGAEWRGIGVLTALAPPSVLAAAWASTALDGTIRGAGWSAAEIAGRVVDRIPVALLRRAIRQKAETDALSAALADARRVHADPASASSERLMVGVGRGRVPVDASEIEWIASAGNYAVVHWRDREGLLRETLQTLESRLAERGFARSHRSTLVNLAHVRDLRPLADGAWRLTLDSGAELVVSRSYRDGFLARLSRA